jgi:hypothetical protein
VTEADVVGLLDRFESAGVGVWIDGGWGVDALLGAQSPVAWRTQPYSRPDARRVGAWHRQAKPNAATVIRCQAPVGWTTTPRPTKRSDPVLVRTDPPFRVVV